MSEIRVTVKPQGDRWSWEVEVWDFYGDEQQWLSPHMTRILKDYTRPNDFRSGYGSARTEEKARDAARKRLREVAGMIAVSRFDHAVSESCGIKVEL